MKTNKTKFSIINCQLSILLILTAFLSPLTMRADTAAQLATAISKFGAENGTANRFRATATVDTVNVSGDAQVNTTGDTSAAIQTLGSVTVQDNAQVSATTGYAIYSRGVNSTITVSGGTVGVTTGTAINAEGANPTITVSGGLVFAYGSAIYGAGNVIYSNNAASFTGATGTGMIIAWNRAAGKTTYTQGGSNDLVWSPASATAKWNNSGTTGGISYKNGTNAGFFPISGVTVTAGAAIETVETPGVTVYSQDGNLMVKSETLTIQSVSVYTVSGQLLKTVEPGSNQVSIPQSHSPSILIVKIAMSDGAIVTKKLVL